MAMTGKDIIKALECCAGDGSCAECPYDVGCVNGNHRLAEDTLKLIKRQQAEIERLHEVINGFEEQAHKELMAYMQLSEKYQNAKSEAVKEFVERLREQSIMLQYDEMCYDYVEAVRMIEIEHTLKKLPEVK